MFRDMMYVRNDNPQPSPFAGSWPNSVGPASKPMVHHHLQAEVLSADPAARASFLEIRLGRRRRRRRRKGTGDL